MDPDHDGELTVSRRGGMTPREDALLAPRRVDAPRTTMVVWGRSVVPVGRWPQPDAHPEERRATSAVERIARHAAALLGAPVSVVSLVGDDVRRGNAPADAGTARGDAPAVPASHAAICRHVAAVDQPVVIADTTTSGLHAARLAAQDLQLLAYAGVPIRSADGDVIGTVCVGDHRRRAWSASDTAVLEELAEIAAYEVELEGDLRAARELDALTGLPNRASCARLLGERQLLTRAAGTAVATLVIDLRQLGLVNESRGRRGGDRLLMEVARRLVAALEDCTVARVGGNQFAVVADARDAREVMELADRVRRALGARGGADGYHAELSAAIGMVLDDEEDHPDDLLDAACVAAARAKEAPNHVGTTPPGPSRARATSRLQIEVALRGAIDAGELAVHYQPLVNLSRGALSGFEALTRWTSPRLGPVAPGEFIPAAEESGLIAVIGAMVLERACRDAAGWRAADPAHLIGVSVNVSPSELTPRLPGQVADVLRRTGLAPGRLTLELTESVVMSADGPTADVLVQLGAMGVHLALDDFGTGFSSLSRLAELPLDVLKIDGGFIARLDDPRTRTIVAATIAMARSLELSVTAEGIETAEQRRLVTEMGCTHGQGFGLGRPAGVRTARELVRRSPAAL